MRELYPKFIIEDNTLTIGKCVFHKELAINKDDVTGGGMYNFNSDKKNF